MRAFHSMICMFAAGLLALGCSGGGSGDAPAAASGAAGTARPAATAAAVTAAAATTGTAAAAGGVPWTDAPEISMAPARPVEANLKGAMTTFSNVTVFLKEGRWFVNLSEPESVESDKRQRIYFTTDKTLATGKFESEGRIGTCSTSILPKGGRETLNQQWEGSWVLEITEWKLDKPVEKAAKEETVGRAKGRVVLMCEYGKDKASVAGTFEAAVKVY